MRVFFILMALFALAVSGCVSRQRAETEKREAFIAGQKQAMSQLQGKPKTVTVRGDVRNSTVPWSEGLTVATAIYQAEYTGFTNPKTIFVIHQGQGIEISANDLLHGRDMQLDAGDIIEIRH